MMLVLGTGAFAQNAQQAPASRGQIDYSKPVTTNGKVQTTNPNRVRPVSDSYNTPVAVPAGKRTQPAGTARPAVNSSATATGQKK